MTKINISIDNGHVKKLITKVGTGMNFFHDIDRKHGNLDGKALRTTYQALNPFNPSVIENENKCCDFSPVNL